MKIQEWLILKLGGQIKDTTNNPTYHQTVINSKYWKDWIIHCEKTNQFDIWESIECGWLSEKHFDAFMRWSCHKYYVKKTKNK